MTTQPRERPVPCLMCGLSYRHGKPSFRTMTWNNSGRCDAHEDIPVQVAKRAEAKNDG